MVKKPAHEHIITVSPGHMPKFIIFAQGARPLALRAWLVISKTRSSTIAKCPNSRRRQNRFRLVNHGRGKDLVDYGHHLGTES